MVLKSFSGSWTPSGLRVLWVIRANLQRSKAVCETCVLSYISVLISHLEMKQVAQISGVTPFQGLPAFLRLCVFAIFSRLPQPFVKENSV